jgi:hypothetical protein
MLEGLLTGIKKPLLATLAALSISAYSQTPIYEPSPEQKIWEQAQNIELIYNNTPDNLDLKTASRTTAPITLIRGINGNSIAFGYTLLDPDKNPNQFSQKEKQEYFEGPRLYQNNSCIGLFTLPGTKVKINKQFGLIAKETRFGFASAEIEEKFLTPKEEMNTWLENTIEIVSDLTDQYDIINESVKRLSLGIADKPTRERIQDFFSYQKKLAIKRKNPYPQLSFIPIPLDLTDGRELSRLIALEVFPPQNYNGTSLPIILYFNGSFFTGSPTKTAPNLHTVDSGNLEAMIKLEVSTQATPTSSSGIDGIYYYPEKKQEELKGFNISGTNVYMIVDDRRMKFQLTERHKQKYLKLIKRGSGDIDLPLDFSGNKLEIKAPSGYPEIGLDGILIKQP